MLKQNFKKVTASVTAADILNTQELASVEKSVEDIIINDAEIVQADETVVDSYVCPLSVNYAELEAILSPLGESVTDYVGDRLPEDEVKRIEKDFKIYLTTKHK